jgi:hypothetical protein
MLALNRHTNVAGLIRLMEYITTDTLGASKPKWHIERKH